MPTMPALIGPRSCAKRTLRQVAAPRCRWKRRILESTRTYAMSTFYLLPARPLFGDRLTTFLQTLLPGLDWDMSARTGLADAVADVAVSETDAFLVFRDDLPAGERVAQALVDG